MKFVEISSSSFNEFFGNENENFVYFFYSRQLNCQYLIWKKSIEFSSNKKQQKIDQNDWTGRNPIDLRPFLKLSVFKFNSFLSMEISLGKWENGFGLKIQFEASIFPPPYAETSGNFKLRNNFISKYTTINTPSNVLWFWHLILKSGSWRLFIGFKRFPYLTAA